MTTTETKINKADLVKDSVDINTHRLALHRRLRDLVADINVTRAAADSSRPGALEELRALEAEAAHVQKDLAVIEEGDRFYAAAARLERERIEAENEANHYANATAAVGLTEEAAQKVDDACYYMKAVMDQLAQAARGAVAHGYHDPRNDPLTGIEQFLLRALVNAGINLNMPGLSMGLPMTAHIRQVTRLPTLEIYKRLKKEGLI